MTVTKLLEKLRKQLKDTQAAIELIEGFAGTGEIKRKEILKSVRPLHWSKQPDVDPVRLARWKKKMAKNALKANSAKKKLRA